MSSGNEIYHLLFETATEGLVVTNTEGTIELVNPGAVSMFGYTKEEMIGQSISLLIPKRYHEKHKTYRENYTKNPKKRSMGLGMDLFARHKNGNDFPVEISLNSFVQDGRKLFIALVSDITKRKEVEKELQELNTLLESKVISRTRDLEEAMDKLRNVNFYLETEIDKRKAAEKQMLASLRKERELNEMKSRFVAMASHEFRTPLSGILSSNSLIDRYNETSNQEKIAKHTSKIKKSVQSLTEILNDFLSLEKLETGHIEVMHVPLDLEKFITDSIEDLKGIAKLDQEINYQHTSGTKEINLDRNVFRVVVNNLISNAIKYSPEGENVGIETKTKDGILTFLVKDSGIGIPEQDQKYLFDLFFRAKNTENIGGTGLGLNIVKKHLDLIKGEIHFESVEGKGTTFTVTVPLTDTAP